MVVPDWFIKLLESLGLRESEAKQLAKKLAAAQEEQRQLKAESRDRVKEIEKLESECIRLKSEFDSRTGASKNEYAILLEDAINQLENFKKLQGVAAKHFNVVNSMVMGYKLLDDAIKHPSKLDELGITSDNVKMMLEDLEADLKEAGTINAPSVESEKNAARVENFYNQYFNNAPAVAENTNVAVEAPAPENADDAAAARINELFNKHFGEENAAAEKQENKLEVN